MKIRTGKAIDYGLDLKSSIEHNNKSLGKLNAGFDDIGETCLSLLTQKQIKSMYPIQNARYNFMMLLEQEFNFERNLVYTNLVHKMENDTSEQMSDQECMEKVDFLDRFTLYLIDKILHGIFSSCHILRRKNKMN